MAYKNPYAKDVDPNAKAVKYLRNRMDGFNKGESQLRAGYADVYHGTQIESSATYKAAIERYLMTDQRVAAELNKVIAQDGSMSAKNRAIDIYLKLKNLYPTEQAEMEAGTVKVIISK